jgi:hypothetical protein
MTGSIDVGASDLGRETQGAGFDGPALASPTRNGLMAAADKVKLDAIAPVTTTVQGLMSAADKVKLNGIEAGATGDQTPAEILTAIKTVDGAASGLDADLLDGQHGSFYQDAANLTGTIADARLPATQTGKTFTTNLTIQGTSPTLVMLDTDASAYDYWVHVNSNQFYVLVDRTNSGTWDAPHPLQLDAVNNIAYFFGAKAWHANNDGAGSGLDADLLDGLNSSSAAGTANTIPARDTQGDITARLLRAEYASTSGSTGAYFVVQNALGTTAAGADNYHRAMTAAQAAAVLDTPLATSGAVYDRIEQRGSDWGQYWVTNGSAAAIAGMSVGAIGTYAMCGVTVASPTLVPGQTIAGSSLKYSNANNSQYATPPTGTWRCMGHVLPGGLTSVFLRIA